MDWTRREAMRWMTAAVGVGAVGGLSLPAWARLRAAAAQPILPWSELAKGDNTTVWLSGPNVQGGNVIIVSGLSSAVVVDSKFGYLSEAIREDAIKLTKRRGDAFELVLVNTHHHADHSGGNCSFSSRPDGVETSILAHEFASPRIEAQHERYVQTIRNGPGALARTPFAKRALPLATDLADRVGELDAEAWAPTELVEDRRSLVKIGWEGDMANEELVQDAKELPAFAAASFGPGHTDNDLVVLFKVQGLNLIHAGDLIFNGLHPFFDQNAGVTSLGWINSLNEIEKLCDDETIVVPGHGPVGDKSIVVEMRRYIEQLRESVKADIGNGVSKEDAQAKTYDFMKGRQFEQLRPIAIGVVYDELLEE